MDSAEVSSSLRRVARAQDSSLRASLQRVVEACVPVFDVTGCGLMIADATSELHYAVATDGPGRELERMQLEAGVGPCVDTYVHDCVVVCSDLATDERWPEIAAQVGPLGVHGMLGIPVHVSGIIIGSLDVYVAEPHVWGRNEQQALVRYGEVIGELTESALAAHQSGELADQLNYALEHRIPIERAIGFLMARDGLNHPRAFERLRRSARGSRRKIGSVANDLLETGQLPDDA